LKENGMTTDDTSDLALYDAANGYAVITLNRPERKNSWSADLQEAFFDALDRADRDMAVHAVVVTGAGDYFCPGGDISHLSDDARAGGIAGVPGHRPMTHQLSINKPIIAAVNGACAGFGFVVAAMCDVRFAARGAKFTTSFARRGVAAEHTITYLLPRQVGLQRALDLLLTGRVFEADEAEALGFVLRVVDRDEVLATACAYARELAEWCSPTAMAVIRRQVYDDLDNDFVTARDQSVELMKRFSRRPDFQEGVLSFVERRPPRFPPRDADFAITADTT
jgi:enoyl-CoA hydratase/carnithine racemase